MNKGWMLLILTTIGLSILLIFSFQWHFWSAKSAVTIFGGTQDNQTIVDPAACQAKRIEANTDDSDVIPPLTFIRDIQEHLLECDPNQSATLRLTATFHPEQIFIPGFPSQAELNADQRLRGVVTSLLTLGYDATQIDRICLQGSSNRLRMKIVEQH